MSKSITPPAKAPALGGSILGAALLGAVAGGTAAAARGIRQVKAGETTREAVVRDVAREAGTTSIAAGAATAVVCALPIGPFLSALGIIVLATGAKYSMDSLVRNAPALAPAPAGDTKKSPAAKAAKPATKKAATKKSTAKKSPAKKPTAKQTAKPAEPAETA